MVIKAQHVADEQLESRLQEVIRIEINYPQDMVRKLYGFSDIYTMVTFLSM